ncbi:MAG: S8 family serine peptidase [Actinomycetota bacterium]|nr:S8 family serine peptidase [Actinomycetota bacterium]
MKKSFIAVIALVALAASAAPAGAFSNDPYFARQWGHHKIQAEQAWATTNGSGALIAVVDSGVDLTHPDLQTNIVNNSNADFVEPNGTCSGGGKKGRTCTQDGAQDKNGHGTHVAGIVGAIANNGIGVAGVAPGARILPVRVLDANGDGTTEHVAAGIRYAADQGADVINLSLGFLSGQGEAVALIGVLDPVYDALDYAWSRGSVVLVAAGNDSVPLCAEPASGHDVICVGATDSRDLISWYSNSDASSFDTYLTAPGGEGFSFLSFGPNSPTAATCAGDVFSTYLRTKTSFCSTEPGYEAIAGTSMAAPHASGVAGLLAAKGLSNQQIVDCLKRTSDDLGAPGRDPIYGYGRVNALRAVTSC